MSGLINTLSVGLQHRVIASGAKGSDSGVGLPLELSRESDGRRRVSVGWSEVQLI